MFIYYYYENSSMSLFIKLTQDLSWHFAVMLQHDQRYPLAEALYFLLAFFLTLSDHREGSLKLRKCRLNIPIQSKATIIIIFAGWISHTHTHKIFFSSQRFEKKKKKKICLIVSISEECLEYEVTKYIYA